MSRIYLILSIETKATFVLEEFYNMDMTLPCSPAQRLLSMLGTSTQITEQTIHAMVTSDQYVLEEGEEISAMCVIKRSLKHNQKVHLHFEDSEKAFDGVD